MKVSKSVMKAIDEWEQGDHESAILHACNAVQGTAKKVTPDLGDKARFVKLLRDNYFILGPMGAPGVRLSDQVFPVKVRGATGPRGLPDIADVIYGIHRCTHAHGDELPNGFSLIPDAAQETDTKFGTTITRLEVQKGTIRLSDRIIFALCAVAVLSPVNKDQFIPGDYYFTFGSSAVLPINDWWGRAEDFKKVIAAEPIPEGIFDFGDWTRSGTPI